MLVLRDGTSSVQGLQDSSAYASVPFTRTRLLCHSEIGSPGRTRMQQSPPHAQARRGGLSWWSRDFSCFP